MKSVALTVCATSSHSTDHHSPSATVVIASSCPTMYCFSRSSNGDIRLSSASFLSLDYKHKNSHGRTLPRNFQAKFTFSGTYTSISHKVWHLRNGTFSQGFSTLASMVQEPFSLLNAVPLKVVLNLRCQHTVRSECRCALIKGVGVEEP